MKSQFSHTIHHTGLKFQKVQKWLGSHSPKDRAQMWAKSSRAKLTTSLKLHFLSCSLKNFYGGGIIFFIRDFFFRHNGTKKAPLVLDERCWERARLLSREKSRPKNAAAQRRCFTDIHMVQQRNETESKVKKTSKKKSKHIQQSKKGELVGLRRALCDSQPVIRCRYVGKKSHTQFSNGKKTLK